MLYWNTVNDELRNALLVIMKASAFYSFRLVGGTSLSLQLGHRKSIDIDLFTDAPYKSVDFDKLEIFLKDNFKYVDPGLKILPGMGKSFLIGESATNAIKLDIYYTDTFMQEPVVEDAIRMATIEEIIAMKIDVIARKGRKKDFWDIHELLDKFSITHMLALHKQRYEYSHDESEILKNFIDFTQADGDFEPNCMRGKYWELIKLDITEKINELKNSK